MKTPAVVGIVVGAHVVVVASILLIQGCGTFSRSVSAPQPPVMPPVVEEPQPTLPTPVVAPPAKSWPAETTTYIIRKGETLSEIAHRYDLSVKELAALNGMEDANKIRAGQKIILPGTVPADRPKPTPRPAAVTESDGAYVVQRGDSLSVLAARFGTTVAELRAANGLTGDMIRVGQKLVIPGAGAATVRAEPEPEPEPMLPVISEMDLDAEPVEEVAPPPAPVPEETGEYRIHVVEPNEDLYTVAMMFGVSPTKLKELNGLTDGEIVEGQRLKIPMAE